MMVEDPRLLERIRDLADEPLEGEREPLLMRIENTLTDGYARALALEAERIRIERRLGEVAAQLREGDALRKVSEIAALADRLSAADGDLVRLRTELHTLRKRAADVRTVA